MCPTNITLFCVSLSGYHAEGYHAPYLPPRAITPVYTSRLPHQSHHAPPIHVHRVITPAISNSYFVVLSFAGFYATCTSPPTPPPGATRYNLLHTLKSPTCILGNWHNVHFSPKQGFCTLLSFERRNIKAGGIYGSMDRNQAATYYI